MNNAAIKFLAAIFLMALAIAPLKAQTNMTNGTGASSGPTNFVSGQVSQYRHHRKDEGFFVNGLGVPGAGMLFCLTIVAISIYARHRRDKMLHETIRAMIEKGVPVNADVVDQLGGRCSQWQSGYPSNRRYYRSRRLLPGLILTGIGIALLMSDHWHSRAGMIVLFIGIAFLIVWLVERNQNNDQQPPNSNERSS